ncbi:nucleoside diphosphate-linked moiety X motif 8 isoform X2 [Notolabrus celidotus]|uniref:nucleoside diphosphate-linked moiety X motif 8 isoform X2 n=1 Tax=Notolabrus celidotus TaxID=1203425 RepID=UPI00148FA568|nr:nucleoside diphosphate-linked moiety X motif 8 isoform X2 [Notolabrus celidotus]
MYRGPQILTWSCPIRQFLRLRESHLSTLSDHTGPARDFKRRRYERICGSKERSSLSSKIEPPSTQLSSCSLYCGNHQLSEASFQNLKSKAILSSPQHTPQFSASLKAKLRSDSLECTFVEDLNQNVKAVSTDQNLLVNTTCLQPWTRPWDSHQPSHQITREPSFLFTLRSSMLKGRHKGDVSFAGGKSDPSDGDVMATALREAREELGVNVPTERVWGVLKPLRDRSGMIIAPVLANLGPLEELSFKPNPGEVEEIFTMSLSHLCNPKNRGYTHFRTGDKFGYTLPVFRNGKHRVWGLTAVALDHTLKLVVRP